MGQADYLKRGDWNVICDRCGFKRKASSCKMDGQQPGLFVCADTCWDPRSPLDYVSGVPDQMSVPVPRPDIATPVLDIDHYEVADEASGTLPP